MRGLRDVRFYLFGVYALVIPVGLFAPEGRGTVATGVAQRNPWLSIGRHLSSRRNDGDSMVQPSFAPLGQAFLVVIDSTGSASGDSVAALLHPWLHSHAPLGRATDHTIFDTI